MPTIKQITVGELVYNIGGGASVEFNSNEEKLIIDNYGTGESTPADTIVDCPSVPAEVDANSSDLIRVGDKLYYKKAIVDAEAGTISYGYIEILTTTNVIAEGTYVEANVPETATNSLENIKIGSVTYSMPSASNDGGVSIFTPIRGE